MAEVLAKAEKYINGEEALVSKKGSSSTHKEKSRIDKRRGRSPKRQSDRERTIPGTASSIGTTGTAQTTTYNSRGK